MNRCRSTVLPGAVLSSTVLLAISLSSCGGPSTGPGSATGTTPSATTGAATLTLDPVAAGRHVSEANLVLSTQLTPTTASASPVSIDFEARRSGAKTWKALGTAAANPAGQAALTVHLWKTSDVRASIHGVPPTSDSRTGVVKVSVVPAGSVVAMPKGAPAPGKSPVANVRAVGSGAQATVSVVPDVIWASMQGLSWHRGCLARSGLRLVQVNFWGFDGYRYRGRLIVASNLATKVAAAFTTLYAKKYPIRSMLLPDVFGQMPNGVGANDLAQMAVGNTSAFNCRYVVGQEAKHVLSLHATGRAVDVNTWENPYVGPTGTLPDSWFLRHRPASDPAVITPTGLVRTAFSKQGFSWGGAWKQPDLQHFQK